MTGLSERNDTHKRCLEDVEAHEDLLGGSESSYLGWSILDFDHAVDTGGKQDKDCPRHRLQHDRPAAALQPVQPHDRKLSQRCLEEEDDYNPHLRHEQREQNPDHRKPSPNADKAKSKEDNESIQHKVLYACKDFDRSIDRADGLKNLMCWNDEGSRDVRHWRHCQAGRVKGDALFFFLRPCRLFNYSINDYRDYQRNIFRHSSNFFIVPWTLQGRIFDDLTYK